MLDSTGAEAPPRSPLSLSVCAAGLTYEGKPLFTALAFTAQPGAWTCLLGPSGVGKTSLLRLIAGLIEPLPGSEIMAGDGSTPRGRLSYMAQQDLLLPWLSARDNVMLGAVLRGEARSPARARANHLLALVGLADKATRLPATLSGGERQRVALARTLFEDTPIILMDEPFSQLDALTRHQMQEEAARLLAGRTVLHVTHDPWEALRLAHQVYVLAGRPASLQAGMHVPGAPPRDIGLPVLAPLRAALLEQLALAAPVSARAQ
jgi:putative hydroxymethylpyrimidine transport system ATP-binding protein